MHAWIVAAFVDRRHAGNDAAVVMCGEGFPATARMQAVARRLALPTTAFLVPEAATRYRIRWFTPCKELNLCGHATIASACYLYDVVGIPASTELGFLAPGGPLYARRRNGSISLDLPRMDVTACAPPDGLEAALGARVLGCARAIDDLLTELESEDAVAGVRPDFAALARIDCRGHVVTARAEQQPADFVSRSFFPSLGVDEDQVCVSAHCKLGPYWGSRLGKDRLTAIQLSPRGGRLLVSVRGDRVHVAGAAQVRRSVPVSG